MSSLLGSLLEPCVAKIEIEARTRAKQIALREYINGDQTKKLVLWSDGSCKIQGTGLAFVWKENHTGKDWSHRIFMLDRSFNSNMAEFFAFYKAIQFALQRCIQNPAISKVVLYTDCQAVLRRIRDHHDMLPSRRRTFARQLELAKIKTIARELNDMAIKVLFRWVPGHSEVPGNCEADRSAELASKKRYEYSTLDLLLPPSNGYIEGPQSTQEPRMDLRCIQYGGVEKIAASRRTRSRRLYAAHIQRAIHEVEMNMGNDLLDILERSVDEQIADSQEEQNASLSGIQA